MKSTSSRYEMDMTRGPILMNMIRFSIPLMLSSVLQLFYNAADMVVVGRFAGSSALAAVGATGAVTSLLVNLFMGLSVGACVVVAQYYGADKGEAVSQSVHTSVALALVGGIGIGLVGIVVARPLLTAMDTPADILDQAVLYMQIYFAGMPANLTYNFSEAVLRAVGDTSRPMYYLTAAGIINVVLNLIFVIVFHMNVAGVALATMISQCVSAVLVLRCLIRMEGFLHLDIRRLRLYRDKVGQIVRVGVPAGLKSSMFAISNTLIQSSINSFGSVAIAGNTAASNIESFISTPLAAFHQAAMSFTSQCYGARKPERFGKIAWCGSFLVITVGFVMGVAVTYFGRPLLSIYGAEEAVIEWGMVRMKIMATTCFLGSVGNIFVFGLRAMGNSMFPMLMSILCICVFRVFWIYTVFAAWPTEEILYYSYPISWILATVVHLISFLVYKRKVTRRMLAEQ